MSKIKIFSPQRAKKVGSKVHPAAFWEYIAAYGFGDSCNIDAPADDGIPWYMLMRLSSPRHIHPDLAKSIGATCVFDELTPSELRLLVIGNGYLLLDMGIEAFFSHDQYFEALHSAAALYGIKSSNIIIMNNNLRSDQYYAIYCDTNSIEYRATFIGVNVGPWLYVAKSCLSNKRQGDSGKKNADNIELYIKDRTRRFVSFNGRDRPHRFYLLSWMFAKGFLSDSWVSFLAYDASRKSQKGELDVNERNKYVEELQKRYSTFPFGDQVVPHIGGF